MRSACVSLARLSKPALGFSRPAQDLRWLSELAPALPTDAAGPSGATAASAVSGNGNGGRSLADSYAALVAAGTLQHDPQQAACVERLDRLRSELASHSEQVR